MLLSEQEQRRFARVMKDPALYARHMLRQDLWHTPEAILRSVWANPRTIVAACHASSKTHTAAVATLAWCGMKTNGVVITSAPTFTQVERVIWPEIHTIIGQSIVQWPSYPDLTDTELYIGAKNGAFGISTNRGVRMQGFHGEILVIVDEAMGYEDDNWTAIEGMRAGGRVHVLALLNPTGIGGTAYEAFHKNAPFWSRFNIDAFETPNLQGLTEETLMALPEHELDRNVRPYLITRRYVRDKFVEWGPDSSIYQSRIRGRFPLQADSAVYPLAWIQAAAKRPAIEVPGPIEGGLDPAGPGKDESVLTFRQDGNLLEQHIWQGTDIRGRVKMACAPYVVRGRLKVLRYDVGGLGYYLGKDLEDDKLPVLAVNNTEEWGDHKLFANKRAEAGWALRERLQRNKINGGPVTRLDGTRTPGILEDPQTISEFTSQVWGPDPSGRVLFEKKEKMRRRGLKSPGRMESIILACLESDASNAALFRGTATRDDLNRTPMAGIRNLEF